MENIFCRKIKKGSLKKFTFVTHGLCLMSEYNGNAFHHI